MPAIRPFQTSLYLSLALAVLSIGVASGDLLPELPFLTGFSLILLGVAYFLEGRWQLSLRAANMVGLGLGAVLALWGVFQLVRPATNLTDVLPWPASALPYLGPVIMILIPAKMLRPKHMGDYWAMHGLGILAMSLACAMAADGMFVFLFAAYAIAFVWSLSTFHLYRELGPERANEPLPGGRWRSLRPAIIWAGLAGAVAFPFFWATPRTGGQWELGINTRGRLTGLTEGPLDLNSAGPVAVNQEKVFEVHAADANGQPILTLPSDLRFRAYGRINYDGGRWVRNTAYNLGADRSFSPAGLSRDPKERIDNFGSDTVFLTYRYVQRQSRTPPLADPVAWRSGQIVPAASRYSDGSYRSFVQRTDGTIEGQFEDINVADYIQAWVPPERPDEGPVIRVNPTAYENLNRLPRGLPKLRGYTDRLITRLVAQGTLPAAVETDLDPDTRSRLPQHHLAIARALEHHLASSGEFTYTLDLKRDDKTIDPTEDFVLNTKAGHCQRFATALVLILRSQGIPCQMALGYRGCEAHGDGWYDVREDFAHAWVEVLVPSEPERRPAGALWDQAMCGDGVAWLALAGGGPGASTVTLPTNWKPMRWVTLDPTPGESQGDTVSDDSLLTQAKQRWQAVLKDILLAYNDQSRAAAGEALQVWLVEGNGLYYVAGAMAAVATLALAYRLWRRKKALYAGYPRTIRQLATVLTGAGYAWPRGATVREFAMTASLRLAEEPRTSAVSGVPILLVAAYYAERFGGRPPGGDEAKQLLADLRKLRLALA
jgi:hypothetical protein